MRLGLGTLTIIVSNGIPAAEGIVWVGGSGGYVLWLGRFDPIVRALDILVRSLVHVPEEP
jgi:hypothetical protein